MVAMLMKGPVGHSRSWLLPLVTMIQGHGDLFRAQSLDGPLAHEVMVEAGFNEAVEDFLDKSQVKD